MALMEVLDIPHLDKATLELIYEIHKQIDMPFGLTRMVCGIDAGRNTTKEVEALLTRKSKRPTDIWDVSVLEKLCPPSSKE